jgi:endonuclease-3 related protein
MSAVMDIYWKLLEIHGRQGWWPVTPTCISDCKPVYGVSTRTKKQQFEIILGAILTQSTSWKNVEKAIENLQKHDLVDAEKLKKMTAEDIAQYIRSAGYFNQKAKKIKAFLEYKGEVDREGLLSLWGLGPETVDSILLYAYKKPEFVVDAYTRRMFSAYGLIKTNDSYDSIKEYFEDEIKNSLSSSRRIGKKHAKVDSGDAPSGQPTSSTKNIDSGEDSEFKKELVEIYNEYHALIVAHGKKYYSKKPYGTNDPILHV